MNNSILNEIVVVMQQYSIGFINNIDVFLPTVNKYVGVHEHFFIVKTDTGKYFLKRHHISQKNKVINEINAIKILEYETSLKIPQIIYTKDNSAYFETDANIYVLYQYILGKTLKECGCKTKEFFSFVARVHKTLKDASRKRLYDFQVHEDTFFSKIGELKECVIKDTRYHAGRDIKYINFIERETKALAERIKNWHLPSQIIHGDFLMQNILVEKANDDWWIIDWEKSGSSILSIDLMRSITFTFFNPQKADMNLRVENIIASIQEYMSVTENALTQKELREIPYTYYFYLITNIDFLVRLYQYRINLNEKMAEEDFNICMWFKNNQKDIENGIMKQCKSKIFIV